MAPYPWPAIPKRYPKAIDELIERVVLEPKQVDKLLAQVDGSWLREERVMLHARKKQFQDALNVIVLELDDLTLAERFCLLCNESPESFVLFTSNDGDGTGTVASLPRPHAFVDDGGQPRRFHSNALDECRDGGQFVTLVKVLAHAASQNQISSHDPGYYRERVSTLFWSYASHPDLRPDVVLPVIPADWPLETIAEYLCQAYASMLHQQRTLHIRQKLSSMSYLQTYAVWAKERAKSVSITHETACPVCTRRISDCAFAATADGRVAHVQCMHQSFDSGIPSQAAVTSNEPELAPLL